MWYDCKKYTTPQSAVKESHIVQWQPYGTARKAKVRYAHRFLEMRYCEEYEEALKSMSMAKAQPLQEMEKTPGPAKLTAVNNAHVLAKTRTMKNWTEFLNGMILWVGIRSSHSGAD